MMQKKKSFVNNNWSENLKKLSVNIFIIRFEKSNVEMTETFDILKLVKSKSSIIMER